MTVPFERVPSTFSDTSSSDTIDVDSDDEWKEKLWIPRPDDPIAHECRTLVLCFDGTGDQFDKDNSNIVKFMSLLKKDDPSKQLVYYQTGIGTNTKGDASLPLFHKITQNVDLMVAVTLGHHIREGYEFIMQNYQEGDKICIFGFSRGAYTARALAGMIQKVGLLPAWNRQLLAFAYHMYSSPDEDNVNLCQEFKKTFSTNIKIEFVGVFDTVASVGLIPRYLPFVGSNSAIRFFRHALALDEHRAKFKPSYYRPYTAKHKEIEDACQHSPNDGTGTIGVSQLIDNTVRGSRPPLSRSDSGSTLAPSPSPFGDLPKEYKNGADIIPPSPISRVPSNTSTKSDKSAKRSQKKIINQHELEIHVNAKTKQKTDALEVWFAGAHCDVGGGSVPNATRHSLARIPLRWMIRECFRAGTGIIFDGEMLKKDLGMDVDLDQRKVMEQPKAISPEERANNKIVVDEKANKNGFFKTLALVAFRTLALPITLVVYTACYIFKSKSKCKSKGKGKDKGEGKGKGEGKDEGKDKEEGKDEGKDKEEGKDKDDDEKKDCTAHQGGVEDCVGNEAMEELHDALAPMYDQLKEAPMWWFLEYMWLKEKKEKAIHKHKDEYVWRINRGMGRKVFKHVVHRGIKVHRSVLIRMQAGVQAGEKEYVPLIMPNLVPDNVLEEDKDKHCRAMEKTEWETRNTKNQSGMGAWFEWV